MRHEIWSNSPMRQSLCSFAFRLAACILLLFPVTARAQAPTAALPGAAPEPELSTRLEGRALLPGGEPAVGALVVSNAGGRALSDERGEFALEIDVPESAQRVHLTAVAGSGSSGFSAQRSVSLPFAGGTQRGIILSLQSGSSCTPEWLPTFPGMPGVGPPNARVEALAVFDDGTGAELYCAGAFTSVAGHQASNLAKWDGSSWSAAGGHILGAISDLAVFDDGNGAALYIAGAVTVVDGLPVSRVARWDGSSWSGLGGGFDTPAACLHVHDDGNGSKLYVGGRFSSPAAYIASWDGSSWAALGSGLNNSGGPALGVLSMATFDDGSGGGRQLYVGGQIDTAGSIPVEAVARWDGSSWSDVGGGVTGLSGAPGTIRAMSAYDPGTGAAPTLVVGGTFRVAGSSMVQNVAQWDGTSWSGLGAGLTGSAEIVVRSMHVHDDGLSGRPSLVIGGTFDQAGGFPVSKVAAWDGSAWSGLGNGVFGAPANGVYSLASFDQGSGNGATLFASGDFTQAGGEVALSVAAFRMPDWSPVGSEPGLDASVHALIVHDDGLGGGAALYAGGQFNTARGEPAARIARWDGADWSPLSSGVGSGSTGWVNALAVHDDGLGGGPALYVGGDFSTAGGVPAQNIARWDGNAWSALGMGVNDEVLSLAVYDGGEGPELYAGGHFLSAGGIQAKRIARWNGTDWRAVGTGTTLGPPTPNVRAMVVHDDGSGSGEALYVGGTFKRAGNQFINNVARWDGSNWSPLGAGTSQSVNALIVHDDGLGGGPALYAGGDFDSAGGVPVNRIARWDGLAWSPLGAGTDSGVTCLATYDDGTGDGDALYVGGDFLTAGGTSAQRLARWDGVQWTGLGSDFDRPPLAFAVYDSGAVGGGPDLIVGGEFSVSTPGDSYLARYGGCNSGGPGTGYCFGDGSATACPCANAAGGDEGCANSSGRGARLEAEGTNSASANDLVFRAHELLPGQAAVLFAGANAVNQGDGIVFGDGLRCAGGAGGRFTTELPDAQGTTSWGPGLDLGGALQPGTLWRFQVWYRDPSGSPCGNGFNLSNGYEVLFSS